MTRVTSFSFEKLHFCCHQKIIGSKHAVCSSHAGRVPISLHMLRHERSAPIWLFSFVDLAFLLLIAFTQIDTNRVAEDLDLSQVEMPQIYGDGTPIESASTTPTWQLRINALPAGPVGDHTAPTRAPFALVEPGTDGREIRAISAADLAAQLSVLEMRSPILRVVPATNRCRHGHTLAGNVGLPRAGSEPIVANRFAIGVLEVTHSAAAFLRRAPH